MRTLILIILTVSCGSPKDTSFIDAEYNSVHKLDYILSEDSVALYSNTGLEFVRKGHRYSESLRINFANDSVDNYLQEKIISNQNKHIPIRLYVSKRSDELMIDSLKLIKDINTVFFPNIDLSDTDSGVLVKKESLSVYYHHITISDTDTVIYYMIEADPSIHSMKVSLANRKAKAYFESKIKDYKDVLPIALYYRGIGTKENSFIVDSVKLHTDRNLHLF